MSTSETVRKGDTVEFTTDGGLTGSGKVTWASEAFVRGVGVPGLRFNIGGNAFDQGHLHSLTVKSPAPKVGDVVGASSDLDFPAGSIVVDDDGDIAVRLSSADERWHRLYLHDGGTATLDHNPGGTVVHIGEGVG